MLSNDLVIHLDKYKARSYQQPLFDAVERGFQRILAILPRRAGKDVTAWNLCIQQALKRTGIYYYCLPTFSQGRKVIWNGILNDGTTFLDFIPKELVSNINSQEMKIRFINGSILQIIGSDTFNRSIVGTNPRLIVYSEFALADPRAYYLARPILTANEGTALFISTPRGKNHLWDIYNIARNSPDWFAYKMGVDETHHIPLSEIQRERNDGLMSEDLIQQEYFCSFELGVEGAYYTKYLDNMRLKGQIGYAPYETGFPVHTAWDLGVRDSTSIVFFQLIGSQLRIIDCYEKSKEGLEHYVKVLQAKGYIYGKHIAPADIAVQEWGSGITRREKARQLGINFISANNANIVDGIEAVRTTFSKIWINEETCKPLISALENYRQNYDPVRKVYDIKPCHDWSSHFSDAFRYLCVTLGKIANTADPEALERRFQEAVYGHNLNMPAVFRDDLPPY